MPGIFRSVMTRSTNCSAADSIRFPHLRRTRPGNRHRSRSSSRRRRIFASSSTIRMVRFRGCHDGSQFAGALRWPERKSQSRLLGIRLVAAGLCRPCSSTIFETMESPSPTPVFFVVTNGLKICSRISAATEGHSVQLHLNSLRVRSSGLVGRHLKEFQPCSPMASYAFCTRLTKTCSQRFSSSGTGDRSF